MKHEFIETDNYLNCLAALEELDSLPKDMDMMGLIYGGAGEGKSLIIEKLANDLEAGLVRTRGTWTAKTMLQDICFEIGLPDDGTASSLQTRLIEHLTEKKRILIIDEIDTLFQSNKKILLVVLRDIHDMAKIPIVLTGMQDCEKIFQKDKYYYDRFARKVKMKERSLNDVRKLCNNSDVKIEDDLVKYLYETYKSFRPIKGLITSLESVCESSDLDTVDLSTFKAMEVELNHG